MSAGRQRFRQTHRRAADSRPFRHITRAARRSPPSPRHPGQRVVLVGMAAMMLVSGCAGADRPTPTSASENRAVGDAVRKYGGTLVEAGPKRLVKVDEVRPLISFGYDIREQPVLDPKQFSITTLHGPCGATVATPFRPESGFRVLRSTISLIIEALAEPGSSVANSFIDQFEADQRTGCPAFSEQIGNATSTVTFVRRLDLPAVGDRRLGWLHEVRAPDGKLGYRSTVIVVNGTRALMLAVLAPERPNATQLQELVRITATAS